MPTARPLSEDWPPAPARLPVEADDGFPQAFQFAYAGRTYRVGIYVAVAEHQLEPHGADPRTPIDIAGADPQSRPSGRLVADVVRKADGHDTVLLHRRLLPGLSYVVAELRLDVVRASVAIGNLNGRGPFGSQLDIRVGAA
jgi:hypothetical protein